MIEAKKSIWTLRGFRAYNRQFLRRSFHRLHLDGDLLSLRGDGYTPLLVCVNHSSWWDLLLGLYLEERLPQWDSYAAMDEAQLRRYRFFARLGVIGVDRSSLHGVKEFVNYCHALLKNRPRALWITPQGEFTSNSVRPVRFQPGIGTIAHGLGEFYVCTAAFDYEFWSEKRPEAFISIRPPRRVAVQADFDRRAFVSSVEREMEDHLDSLTALKQQRNPALFTTLMSGEGGISPIYDSLRAIASRLRGERFVGSHGDVVTPQWRKLGQREP